MVGRMKEKLEDGADKLPKADLHQAWSWEERGGWLYRLQGDHVKTYALGVMHHLFDIQLLPHRGFHHLEERKT